MSKKDEKKSVSYETKCVERGCKKTIKVSGVGIKKIDLWNKAKAAGWTVRSTTKVWCAEHSPSSKTKKAKKAAVKPAKKAKPSKVAKVKKVKVTTKGKKTTKTSIPSKKSATIVAFSTTPKTSRSDLLNAAGQPSTTAPEQKDGATE